MTDTGEKVEGKSPHFWELAAVGERLQNAILRRELAQREILDLVKGQTALMLAAGLDPQKHYQADWERQEMVEVDG